MPSHQKLSRSNSKRKTGIQPCRFETWNTNSYCRLCTMANTFVQYLSDRWMLICENFYFLSMCMGLKVLGLANNAPLVINAQKFCDFGVKWPFKVSFKGKVVEVHELDPHPHRVPIFPLLWVFVVSNKSVEDALWCLWNASVLFIKNWKLSSMVSKTRFCPHSFEKQHPCQVHSKR